MRALGERCGICNCPVHRTAGTYARPNPLGRSHATKHHYVAERFFGRSANRAGTLERPLFDPCPWGHEGQFDVFCYECHEELLHNPVLLPEDIAAFARLVKERGLMEDMKSDDRTKAASRIQLFHQVIAEGLKVLGADRQSVAASKGDRPVRD